jgi:uncharacterized protein (DUF983 family)
LRFPAHITVNILLFIIVNSLMMVAVVAKTCCWFEINEPTRCNNFSSLFLLDVYVQLNMFRASPCPSPGA